MTDYERKKIDMELKSFTSKHLEKPSDCRNPEQIQFYISELARKIEALEKACNYAPPWAYTLLAQYTERQNKFLLIEFRSSYQY